MAYAAHVLGTHRNETLPALPRELLLAPKISKEPGKGGDRVMGPGLAQQEEGAV